jgi:ectoine/hydroxyectoine ABC transporter permease protein EhuD
MSGIFTLFNFSGAGEYLPDLLRGALISIELTLSVMALSLVFGLVVALARLTRFRAIRAVATFYIEIIRGTPALLQLFYIYFVLPAFGIKLPPFTAGVIGLTVNYSAYLSEVYRAGIQAVAKGQLEAAQALGMSRTLMMRLIILPQAIRIIVPPLGNYFISLFKDTALASIITVKELIFTGQIIAATNFQYFAIFTIIGAIYLAISYPGSLGVQYLERRMKIGYRHRRAAPVGGPTGSAPQGAVS